MLLSIACRIFNESPELTDLVTALDDLPASSVRYMCTMLGVSQCTLDEIDANYRGDALTKVQKYLQAWLDRDVDTTWTSIVDALRKSKKLNKCGLADKITRKYCLVYIGYTTPMRRFSGVSLNCQVGVV